MKDGLITPKIFKQAMIDALIQLDPRIQVRNPVMFVTFLGAIFVTFIVIVNPFSFFNLQIMLWLWFTVLFANFSGAIAEGRGKAQAASLRKTQKEIFAKVRVDGKIILVSATQLKKGDVVVCEIGDIIPADGEAIEGIATVDDSASTGESAPVIRESG